MSSRRPPGVPTSHSLSRDPVHVNVGGRQGQSQTAQFTGDNGGSWMKGPFEKVLGRLRQKCLS